MKTTNNSTVENLKSFRSRFANDIREGWCSHMTGSQEITFALYEIANTLIVAVDEAEKNNWRVHDRMALILVKRKLNMLINSEDFRYFDELGKMQACGCVTSGVKQHIRVMKSVLADLLGDTEEIAGFEYELETWKNRQTGVL